MISMTGYGHAERQDESYTAFVEVKSYNNRYLDISCSLPGVLSPLETVVRDKLSAVCRRGRVEVYIRFRDTEAEHTITVDSAVAEAYVRAINELRGIAGLQDELRLDHLISRDGVFQCDRVVDTDAAWTVLEPLLDEALESFVAVREEEGKRLKNDILHHLGVIEACVEAFAQHAAEIEETIRLGLKKRFDEVLGNAVDENRVLGEVAVQLTRFSINEEIVRLRTHLKSFRDIASNDHPVGKKLDFLCQEINREINTTGSKSILVEINERVVDAKDAVENVREQLRNVE